MWLGDYPEDHTTVVCMFTTHDDTGAPVAPNSAFEAADVVIFKNGSATEKTTTNGVTMTSPFNSTIGLHCVVIDTSNDTGDSGFWVTGAAYTLVLAADETVDGVAVTKVIGQFGIELYGALRPTTLGRRLDVSAGGEAGLDWANIGSPTTAVNLSGTTVKTATDVETDTADIQSRLPAALVSGRIDASVGAMAAGTLTASALAADAAGEIADAVWDEDATGHQTGGTFGQAIGDPGADTNTIFAAVVTNAAGATIAHDIVTVDGIVDDILLDTAEIGAAGAGLTNINLPDQTMNITGNITGNLSGSVGSVTGNVGGTVAAVTTVNGLANNSVTAAALAADAVTEIQSGLSTLDAAGVRTAVGLASANLDTQLTAIDDLVDTEVAAIKTVVDAVKLKTDSLTFTVAGQVDANIESVNGTEVTGAGTAGDPWGP